MSTSPRFHCFIGPTPVRGASLVEVLVTVVVMSVGLLGVAALQLASLRDGYSSFLRSQATSLGNDIVDRIRANRTAAAAYTVAPIGTAIADYSTQATSDLSTWKAALRNSLPAAPDGSIADGQVVINGNVVTVTIQWGERAETQPITFVTSTEI
jgi:type IV pilus assembly protein PilV